MAKKKLANALGAFTAPATTSTPVHPVEVPEPQNTIATAEVPVAKTKKINQTIQFDPDFAREVKMYVAAHSNPDDKLTLRELVTRSLREYMATHP